MTSADFCSGPREDYSSLQSISVARHFPVSGIDDHAGNGLGPYPGLRLCSAGVSRLHRERESLPEGGMVRFEVGEPFYYFPFHLFPSPSWLFRRFPVSPFLTNGGKV
jgi:hypothetical protein